MAWLAWYDIDRPVIPIDLLPKRLGRRLQCLAALVPVADAAVIVNNFVQAMAYVWGQSGTDKTPLFNRWAVQYHRHALRTEAHLA
jgi:hypothetical protein